MNYPYRFHGSLCWVAPVVLLLAGCLSAQNFNAPSASLAEASDAQPSRQVFNKKIFWAEVGAYTVSNVLDGYTTVAHPAGYEEGGFPRGSSYLLGKHPSTGRYVAIMGAMQIATTFAAYRLEHSQKRYLRIMGHALMAQGIYAHTDGYIGNVLLLNQASSAPEVKLAPAGKQF